MSDVLIVVHGSREDAVVLAEQTAARLEANGTTTHLSLIHI